jgi:hypothetical protein
VDSGRLLANLIYIAYGAFFMNEVRESPPPLPPPSRSAPGPVMISLA